MEKEISSGAMLGIVLIALAAIIGIGFGVFAIAKGTANSGTTSVQEKLETVSESEYTDFDQTIVTGQQVKTAYDNFSGKNAAILVATQALIDKTFWKGSADDSSNALLTSRTAVSYDPANAGATGAYMEKTATNLIKENGFNNDKMYASKTDINKLLVVANGVDGVEKAYMVRKSAANASDQPVVFMNYNALLGFVDESNAGTITVHQANLGFDTTHFVVTSGFKSVNGQVQFNSLAGNLSKSGTIEYLPTSARFNAYLVKDSSGSLMGAAFIQIKNN